MALCLYCTNHCTGSGTRVIIQLQFDKQYNYSLKKKLVDMYFQLSSQTLYDHSIPLLQHYHSTITLCLISSFQSRFDEILLTTIVLW